MKLLIVVTVASALVLGCSTKKIDTNQTKQDSTVVAIAKDTTAKDTTIAAKDTSIADTTKK
jgi:hypothetical protein